MIDLQKAGGIAALAMGLAYVLGFALFATVLDPGAATAGGEAARLDFVLERRGLMQAVMLVIYVGFGLALVVLTAALHERLRRRHAGVMAVASVFGHLWAGLVIASGMVASIGLDRVGSLQATAPDQALVLWRTLGVLQEALGGGVEVVGGLWVLLLSLAAGRGAGFGRLHHGLGLVVGFAGLLSVLPALRELGAVFGLVQIPWFLAVAWTLLRRPPASSANAGAAATGAA